MTFDFTRPRAMQDRTDPELETEALESIPESDGSSWIDVVTCLIAIAAGFLIAAWFSRNVSPTQPHHSWSEQPPNLPNGGALA